MRSMARGRVVLTFAAIVNDIAHIDHSTGAAVLRAFGFRPRSNHFAGRPNKLVAAIDATFSSRFERRRRGALLFSLSACRHACRSSEFTQQVTSSAYQHNRGPPRCTPTPALSRP